MSEDQRQMLASAASMLQTHYPVSRRRERRQDGLDELAAFGLLGLALPDGSGEAGYSVVEEALLHVLLGRHVVTPGALAAALAARLAVAGGRRDLADGIAGAERRVCVAVPAAGAMLLVERADAGLALVFGERELALLDIEGAADSAVEALGHGLPLERVAVAACVEIARSVDSELLDTADLLVSAQLLGVAAATLDLAVAYATMRQQFGQPIGGFQAIKHHCANMAVAAEMASAQLDMAAIALRDGRADASFQVAALRLLAGRAAFANARTSVQIHGGIGFSAEADVHHYLKQAHVLARLGQGADMLGFAAPLVPHTVAQEGA